MAWTTPRTWIAGELVTAALMNTYVRDEFTFLRTQYDATTTIRTTGSSAAITDTDFAILVNATSTHTLPTPVGRTGRQFVIKNIAAATTVTLATAAGTIDGAATQTIAARYDSLTVLSDGTNWNLI